MPKNHNDINLCIFSPLKNAYSETFIRNHIEKLPFNNYVLNGAELSELSHNDQLLFPPTLFNRLQRAIVRKFIKEEHYFEKKRLRSFLKKNKIDVVMAEYGHIGAWVYGSCQQLGIPFVVHFHGNDASHKATLELLKNTYLKMFAYAGGIMSVSHSMTRRLIKLGADPGKITYNCCCIDPALFTASEEKMSAPTFVSVGRFVEKKAPHLTLAAFALAKKTHPSLRLVMIGDGPLLEPCRQLAKAYEIAEDVEFPGILPPEQVAVMISRSLAFVQHSVIAADGGAEGTPVAILEAGACGVPVISTRHEGIMDVVLENKTGILVDEFDIAAMAEAMGYLVDNPSVANAIGKAARTHITGQYTLSRHIEILGKVIADQLKPV